MKTCVWLILTMQCRDKGRGRSGPILNSPDSPLNTSVCRIRQSLELLPQTVCPPVIQYWLEPVLTEAAPYLWIRGCRSTLSQLLDDMLSRWHCSSSQSNGSPVLVTMPNPYGTGAMGTHAQTRWQDGLFTDRSQNSDFWSLGLPPTNKTLVSGTRHVLHTTSRCVYKTILVNSL